VPDSGAVKWFIAVFAVPYAKPGVYGHIVHVWQLRLALAEQIRDGAR
jgi:hypothetical protein